MENNKKTNPILKGLMVFVTYLKNVFIDFFTSFKYNNMKLPAILVALPGVLLGFFLVYHIPTVRSVIPNYSRDVEGSAGTYELAKDADATDPTYFKFVMNGVTYGGESYNLVLTRNYDLEPTLPRLPKPTGLKVTVKGEVLNLTIETPEAAIADHIASYNVYIYQSKDSTDYVIKTINHYVYGTDIDISELGNQGYKVAIQAVAQETDAEYANSEKTSKVSFTVPTAGSKYNQSNYQYIEYAGVYEARTISPEGKALASYKVDLSAAGIATIYANNVATEASFVYNGNNTFTLIARETVNIIPFNYSGMVLFILMLLGILNIFFALSISGKKNLGSVVKTTVTTVAMAICGVLYIVAVMATEKAVSSGAVLLASGATSVITSDTIMSFTFIIISIVASIAGCVLGYIFYDRNYEKVTF